MHRWTIPIVLLLVIAMFAWQKQHAAAPMQTVPMPVPIRSADNTHAPFIDAPTAATSNTSPSHASQPDSLPPEVAETLALIQHGGPFSHRQDGVVFQNREHRLPEQDTGYYHEYTVPTPGAGDRGARRIITGGDPPGIYYYTDDHYRSFRTLEVAR